MKWLHIVVTGSPPVRLTFSASLAHAMSKAYWPCHGETQSRSPRSPRMSRTQADEDTTHTLRWNNGAFMSPEMQRCSRVFVSEESRPLSCDFGDARKPAGIPQFAGVGGGVEWGHRRLISEGSPAGLLRVGYLRREGQRQHRTPATNI